MSRKLTLHHVPVDAKCHGAIFGSSEHTCAYPKSCKNLGYCYLRGWYYGATIQHEKAAAKKQMHQALDFAHAKRNDLPLPRCWRHVVARDTVMEEHYPAAEPAYNASATAAITSGEATALPGTKPGTYTAPPDGWVCFHCGVRFHTAGAARHHFGGDPHTVPRCQESNNKRRELEDRLARVLVRLEGTRRNLHQKLNIHHVYLVGATGEKRVTCNPYGLHHLEDAKHDAAQWAAIFGCEVEVFL